MNKSITSKLFPILITICILPFTEDLMAQERVPLVYHRGVYYVNAEVNGLPLDFIFDTGASEVLMSLAEVMFMMKHGYLDTSDIGQEKNFQIADGSTVEGTAFLIRELKIGDLVLKDVAAAFVTELGAPLLLGQSAIQKLGDWRIDPATIELVIGEGSEYNVWNDEDTEQNDLMMAQITLRAFVLAEDARDLDKIMNFFSSKTRRYWDVRYPSLEVIRSSYLNNWKRVSASSNKVLAIRRTGARTYEMDTMFSYYHSSNERKETIRSTVVFVLDEEGRILEVYGKTRQ